MWEIIRSGGVLMTPIIFCSLLATAIFFERLWVLRLNKIVPKELLPEIWQQLQDETLDASELDKLRQHSPLGRVLAAGLAKRHLDRQAVKEGIEDAGRHVVHDLERYFNVLNTIVGISPLLGLLGTVVGMIQTFSAIGASGVGDPHAMAAGISTALITTVGGLSVAIPALVGYRYLKGKVADLVLELEYQSITLLDALYGAAGEVKKPTRRTVRKAVTP